MLLGERGSRAAWQLKVRGTVCKPRVEYADGTLRITQGGSTVRVEPASILQVHECQMADQVHHGDETCHLILLADAFWVDRFNGRWRLGRCNRIAEDPAGHCDYKVNDWAHSMEDATARDPWPQNMADRWFRLLFENEAEALGHVGGERWVTTSTRAARYYPARR